MNIKDKYALVGMGVINLSRSSGLSASDLAVRASLLAIQDAGLKSSDINGFVCQQAGGGSAHSNDIVRNAGLNADVIWELAGTGTHGIGVFLAAMGALETGLCDTIMLVYTSVSPPPGAKPGGGPPDRSLESTYGLFGPAGMAAAWARRYMHLYPVTEHHLGAVAVTLREYANKRPDAAMHDKKLTLDEYLQSRYIAEPLRARDCCLVSDGAAALIFTTARKARNLKRRPVYVMGYGQEHSTGRVQLSPEAVFEFDGAMTREMSRKALKRAGIELKDIDTAQFYDAFSINIIDQLSGYGFCQRGEEGAFIEAGNLGLNGAIPSNTSGTLLSWGYLHVWTHFIEAARQLRGEAGECQVKDARTCLVTGGLSAMGSGLTAACFILRN
jgi:acetyl-CoA acetyltransferase